MKKGIKVFVLLTVLAGVCYGVVLKAPFLFDDEHFILKNKTVHTFDLREMYTTSTTHGSLNSGSFYRPNQQFVYATLYYFFGLNAGVFHLSVVLVHLLNAFLLYVLLLRLSFSVRAGLVASVLFLIHPVQTESISYISGLSEPLGLGFVLAGLIFFIQSLSDSGFRRSFKFILSSMFFLIGLFCKESMVIFFPLTVIVTWYIHLIREKKAGAFVWAAQTFFFILMAGYFYLKFSVFNFTSSLGLTSGDDIYNSNIFIRLLNFISFLWDYAKLIIFPKDLFYEKPYIVLSEIFSFRAAFGFLCLGALSASIIWRKRVPVLFLGLSWFFAALLPYTGLIPINAMFLEHWLYVPLVGICLMVGRLSDIADQKGKAQVFWIVFVILAVLCVGRTIKRNQQWADVEQFYLNELRYSSGSVRMFNNLAMHYADHKDYSKAISYYNRAAQLSKIFPHPHHNLSTIYLETGDVPRAIQQLYYALKIDPTFIFSLERLQQIYQSSGQAAKAEALTPFIRNSQNRLPNDWGRLEAVILAQ